MRNDLPKRARTRAGFLVPILLLLAAGCLLTPPAPRGSSAPAGATRPAVAVTSRVIRSPRPLTIHVISVDLSRPGVEIVCAPASDPDGNGPARTSLVSPTALFTNAALVAAVNANAFAVVSPRASASAQPYVGEAGATFCGLVCADGRLLNGPAPGFESFWVDERGAPHIGHPTAADRVRNGVAGFARLLRAGEPVSRGSDNVLHPRTAVGYSADRRTLWLVVVDGRDPGVSEGMSLHELAVLMRDLGAWEALNLDGGGSSVMLYAPADSVSPTVRVVNRPSTRILGQPVMRPIPNLLGVRVHARPAP